ncbi:putative ASCH domain, PUA-like superfamily, activating signal cointegrator 1 [Helianthus annuus]|nr:putative ASCH domain, PUA-like superfamily, activating signal cointegrator 1 [Helianthus annuus]
MGSRRRDDVNYRYPCLTMHQPWASLLVYGIKRIEGRSWPSPVTDQRDFRRRRLRYNTG